MAEEKLFSEFPPISTEEWEKKIAEDLKGADYFKKLVWQTIDGINVRPYYRDSDMATISFMKTVPGEYPYVRGTKATGNNWRIRQDIEEENISQANILAVESVNNGVDAIGFNAKKITTQKNINALLKDIDLRKTSLHFKKSPSYKTLLEILDDWLKKEYKGFHDIRLSFDLDPMSKLLLEGDLYRKTEEDLIEAGEIISKYKKSYPELITITVSGECFHNAGASAVEELAFSLASGNEYLTQLSNKGIYTDEILQSIEFSFGTGSGYFMEIAKLRAARLLWTKIAEQYNPKKSESLKMHIHCSTSLYNKTTYDSYNNVLRCTTEAMSSAIGGADTISVLPFDISFRKPDKFSYRIARNIQLILKEESYLGHVSDPAGGSYYIEKLTDLLAESAWKLFRDIEGNGGFLEAVRNNIIQDKISETSDKRKELIATRKQTILGINQYPDNTEKIAGSLHKNQIKPYALGKQKKIKTLETVPASESFEKLRMETEKFVSMGNECPKVFLFTIGNLAMRRARAAFASNFFGCCGYDIIDNNGFTTVDEGIEELAKINPRIAVICSSDEEYETLAPEIAAKTKAICPETIIIVAGNPKNIKDKLLRSGVDDFISISSNILMTLTDYHNKLGIS